MYIIKCVNGNALRWQPGTPIEFRGWNYCWGNDEDGVYIFSSLAQAVDVILSNDWPDCVIIPMVI